MIRVVLVDDERPARDGLRILLERDPAFEVVGEAAHGAAAIAAIEALMPDLVFLDVQMPDLNGFEVLSRIRPERRPRVIFVTAHDQHALRAFEVHALDYLLKPISPTRFAEAIERARAAHSLGLASETLANLARALREGQNAVGEGAGTNTEPGTGDAPLDRVTVRDGDRVRVIPVATIRWARAAGTYVTLKVGDREHLIRIALAELERRLPARAFARIHRATIVNVAEVAEIRTLAHGDFEVEMRDGIVLRLSRRYRDRLF